MTRPILIGILVASLCSLAAFGLVLWYFEPDTTGTLGVVLLLVTFAIASFGLLTIGLHQLHTRKRETSLGWLLVSVRQAALIGGVLLLVCIFGLLNWLAWWHLPTGLLAVLLVEIYLRLRVE